MKTINFSYIQLISVVALLSFVSCSKPPLEHVVVQSLDQNWEMSQLDSEEWNPASVPGCVHTDLLKNGIIEDPFYRLNEHNLQWIDKSDWVYRTSFTVDKNILNKQVAELKFPGLDTYAEVYLNDSLILVADNMFREWGVECRDILKKGKNELEIIFRSPIRKGIEKYDALGYTIPVSDNDLAEIGKVPENKKVSIHTRKAGYHFGWDWGPRFVTSGIWKPVFIQGWDQGRINEIQIIQHEINENKALMKAVVEIEANNLTNGELTVLVDDKEVSKRKVNADNITFFAEIPFEIENPKRWWPNGMGDQPLYVVTIELRNNGQLIHEQSERIGLRTVELITDKDDAGNTFHFRVNGRPVFMKGANYIPQDSFLDRVTPEKYNHVIQSAVDANMNMLRIWGGGIYEKDIFYDLCDEKGILVWQDFMFACSMYPGDSLFLENVREEAADNVKRLRNHPSIALWCGNNENLSAWYRWGWKEKVVEEQGEEVANKLWKAYEDVFHNILPSVVRQEDGKRAYWSSSSSAAMGVPDNLTQGDLHYWGVWWGKEPFSSFKENTGRFMSEYGFQSFPEMKTINEYATEEDWDIYSDVMKSHQRSSIGNETIETYMERDYTVPEEFPEFIYVGQVLQGEGIKRAIELHRVQMPYCMGSLYWQINDCWPVASWSGMDYFGRWKAQHYMAKEAFKNVILVPETEGNSTEISVVSDLAEGYEARLTCRILSFTGEILWSSETAVSVPENRSRVVFSFDHTKAGFDKTKSFLEATLTAGDEVKDVAIWYYVSPKFLDLPKDGSIELKSTTLDNGDFLYSLKSDLLVKNLFIEAEGIDGIFSDNYFDLLPGEEYSISFSPEKKGDIPALKIMELTNSFSLVQ